MAEAALPIFHIKYIEGANKYKITNIFGKAGDSYLDTIAHLNLRVKEAEEKIGSRMPLPHSANDWF